MTYLGTAIMGFSLFIFGLLGYVLFDSSGFEKFATFLRYLGLLGFLILAIDGLAFGTILAFFTNK